jgi:hypothetical protein
MIRPLTPADLPAALEISNILPARGTEIPHDPTSISRMICNPRNNAKGFFENDELKTWISYRYSVVEDEKVWIILNICSSIRSTFFSFLRPDVGELIASIFPEAEEKGYYSYLYCVPSSLSEVYYRQWQKNTFLPFANRYQTEDVATIPKNTKPTELWQARLLGGTKPFDVVIKKRTLLKTLP